jgi:RNA 2',3'-cyclic 3'-phosphodiesterase
LSSGERSSARLFVAVDPPAEVCRELGGWARAVAAEGFAGAAGRPRAHQRGPAHPELRVLDAEGLHITLCFLGSRPVEEIEELSFAVTSCSGEVDELSVGAPLWLPPRHPRALAVEVHDASGELERLQRELTAALRDAVDWQPGHRRFRAHLTVARVRGRDVPAAVLAGALGGAVTPPLRFAPRSLTLYRSRLDPSGATYEALASRPLAPGSV